MDAIFVFLLAASFLIVMFSGYPIAFVLGGVAVAFAALGTLLDNFTVVDADMASLRMIGFVANRIFDSLSSYSLIPMSMFIFMGMMLDKSGAAERLLTQMHKVLRPVPGGMAVAVVIIGVVLAASTGIIGASVVLLATIAMPAMRAAGYEDRLGLGVIGATGCLGILIPPSIMLIVMGDQLQIPVGDLFRGAMVPGLLLALFYVGYAVFVALRNPSAAPALAYADPRPLSTAIKDLVGSLLGPLLLIMAVLGSIIFGIATPTEASGIGAAGATLLAFASKRLTWDSFKEVCHETALTTAFLFGLIFGASCFSVVLRGYGGDELIESALHALPLGPNGTLVFILFLVFLLGFFLDWMEIILIVAPLVLPVLSALGHEPAWVAILMAICLQTSFLTPPVGMALFYLKNTVDDVKITDVYRSVLPFIAIQVTILMLAFVLPVLVLW
ncbi:Neu5Ac permease [Thalassovita gelatinovora]|uniref:TRAP transporter large permease protein n=1 Tax=Thalassovita gelatinovora TaxID=53501 RepID=A0A0P1FB60_THAGE|nr:TRAP transporter large permease subunit [Thalassovita gelatinovora]QIZ80711.1 TRAP transporter large permease subunit [Thalassovita gelatinovora]CUH65307.1 Neu5Ac permease [Thalassovita gelatinovora]SEQ89139.1 TRAP transporter, DctM subunit [Thalassovita gelatinovora]